MILEVPWQRLDGDPPPPPPPVEFLRDAASRRPQIIVRDVEGGVWEVGDDGLAVRVEPVVM